MMSKSSLGENAQFLLCTLFFIIPAIWNHYPLVTSDTGAYINNAYHHSLPKDRTILYSYFILLTSFKISLYLTIIFQASLISFVVIKFFQNSLFKSISIKHFWVALFFLIICTSSSWYTSQVMPDIFTPLIFLTSINYFYSRSQKINTFYLGLIYFSILTHNSNLVISLLFFGIIFLISTLRKFNFLRKKALVLMVVSVFAWLSLCSLHYVLGYGFKPSQSSHIFLIAKLSENGILKKYLIEHCDQENFKLCSYKNNLPEHAWDFIWNDNGAFAHSGYWDSSSTEYSKIIKGTITEPKFLWMNIKEGVKATVLQFFKTDIGDGLTPQVEESNPYWKVQEHYSHELKPYLNSKQNQGILSFKIFNQIYFYVFIGSMIVFISLLILRKIKSDFIFLFGLAILFCLLNAFTTGCLANILPRLNSRSIWLIPFIVMLTLLNIHQTQLRQKEER